MFSRGIDKGFGMTELPNSIYVLRHKEHGTLYIRRGTANIAIWATLHGPSSAKGTMSNDARNQWEILKLKVEPCE